MSTRVVAWLMTRPGLFRAGTEMDVWLMATAAFKAWARLEKCPDDFGIALASCGYAPARTATKTAKSGS